MKKIFKRKNSGFTIIEVTIVLAIAGLIMAIVFVAVPALERNARNTQRKSDASHLAGLVSEYASNHNGLLPTAICTSSCSTSGTTTLDLSKENFNIMKIGSISVSTTAPTTGSYAADATSMVIYKGYSCNTATDVISASGTTDFAIGFEVETSGGTQDSCVST